MRFIVFKNKTGEIEKCLMCREVLNRNDVVFEIKMKQMNSTWGDRYDFRYAHRNCFFTRIASFLPEGEELREYKQKAFLKKL